MDIWTSTINYLINWPIIALIVGLAFSALDYKFKLKRLRVISRLWYVYFVYELLLKLRILCSGECNIRIDVLVIHPILIALTLLVLISLPIHLLRSKLS